MTVKFEINLNEKEKKNVLEYNSHVHPSLVSEQWT